MRVHVYRFRPDSGEGLQEYEVEARNGMTVLDALVEIQRHQDPTLAFRYACRVGMCGSCALVINGRERWACRTLLASLAVDTVNLRPLYHFPIVRDLVVDMKPFVDKMRAIVSHFTPADASYASQASRGGQPGRRKAIDDAIECIGCGSCLSACTMVGHDARFVGPAALNRAFTLQADARDHGIADRWTAVLSEDALFRCHSQANCTEVCPMGLSPTQSILALRRLALRAFVSGE
jgi:fumarate reductase iron-sulfur subunit